jgi:hypothetical protein
VLLLSFREEIIGLAEHGRRDERDQKESNYGTSHGQYLLACYLAGRYACRPLAVKCLSEGAA